MSLDPAGINATERNNREPAPRIENQDGELRIVVDGAVQSVDARDGRVPRGYWPALLPNRRPASVLILGLGGGTAAQLLHQRWPGLAIVGVDIDERVVRLAQDEFGLTDPMVTAVAADARDFVRDHRDQFGHVIVDLFIGEQIATVITQRSFLRRIRSLVQPGGTLVWNLYRDRRGEVIRRRVGIGMLPERRILAGLNLVLHFRRRRYVRRDTAVRGG